MDVREAVAAVQARLSGISASGELGEPGISVAPFLTGLDLSLSFDEVAALMGQRLAEARALAVESVVAWEIEEELCATDLAETGGARSVPRSLAELESRLDEVEEWLAEHRMELETIKSGMDEMLRENELVEVQRTNLTALDECLDQVVGALTLDSSVEEMLLDPSVEFDKERRRRRSSASSTSVLRNAVDALEAATRRAKQLPASRAVEERLEQLLSLQSAFCAGAERYARRTLERCARAEQHKPSALESMSAGALRSLLRRRQRELHSAWRIEAGSSIDGLARLKASNSMRRLRKVSATVARDTAYGPLLRAYMRALVNAPEPASGSASPSAALARALDELNDFLRDEVEGRRALFRHVEDQKFEADCLAAEFSELRELLLAVVEAGALAVEAAALVAVVEDAARVSADGRPPWLDDTYSVLRQAATTKWTEFIEQRCRWIMSSDVSRKREHGAGPAAASIEVVAFAEKVERVVADIPRRPETKQLLSDAIAEPAYARLARAFDDWLSRAVAADSKYGLVVALESNDFVAERLGTRQGRASPALANLANKCAAKANDAMRKYSEWMWAYEFAKLDAYFTKLESTSKRQFSDANVRDVPSPSKLAPSLAAVEDHLNKILKRLEKHFPDGSRSDPRLRSKLKAYLLDAFQAKWARYDHLARSLYSEGVQPTAPQFDHIVAGLK